MLNTGKLGETSRLMSLLAVGVGQGPAPPTPPPAIQQHERGGDIKPAQVDVGCACGVVLRQPVREWGRPMDDAVRVPKV